MSLLASNPSLLRNLQELLNDGILTTDEFNAEKTKLLAAPAPASSGPSPSPTEMCGGTTTAELGGALRMLAGAIKDMSAAALAPATPGNVESAKLSTPASTPKRKQPPSAVVTPAVKRPKGQPSIYTMGIKTVVKRKDGTKLIIDESMEAAEFSPCTWQSCGKSCRNAGALTKHMRSHNSVSGGDRGILSMLLTSEQQKQRAINTEVAFHFNYS